MRCAIALGLLVLGVQTSADDLLLDVRRPLQMSAASDSPTHAAHLSLSRPSAHLLKPLGAHLIPSHSGAHLRSSRQGAPSAEAIGTHNSAQAIVAHTSLKLFGHTPKFQPLARTPTLKPLGHTPTLKPLSLTPKLNPLGLTLARPPKLKLFRRTRTLHT